MHRAQILQHRAIQRSLWPPKVSLLRSQFILGPRIAPNPRDHIRQRSLLHHAKGICCKSFCETRRVTKIVIDMKVHSLRRSDSNRLSRRICRSFVLDRYGIKQCVRAIISGMGFGITLRSWSTTTLSQNPPLLAPILAKVLMGGL